MNRSPPGSSVHGILQARILGWVAISNSGDLPKLGIKPASTKSAASADRFFTTSTTWEALSESLQTSLEAQTVNRLPTMWETQVRFLGWEDPLEKAMAPHASTLTWKIPWMEERGRLQSKGLQRVGQD